MAVKRPPKKLPKRSMASSQASRFVQRRISIIFPVVLVSLAVLLLVAATGTRSKSASLDLSDPIYEGEVVNVFPHDPQAFTQGLLYAGKDTLYESTGLYGKSSLRKVSLRTGKVEVLRRLENSYFGEGLTLLGERLYQLTWLKTTGFIYDFHNLSKIQEFKHEMEDGWGLATDGKVLYGSDGTSTFYQIDPQSLKVTRKHTIDYGGLEVRYLNELEYINGEVWANVWQTDCIARIGPQNGTILGWILLPKLREGLLRAGHRRIDVLNGIAWDGDNQRIFVTGKLWPELYEIKLHPVKTKVKPDFIKQQCLA